MFEKLRESLTGFRAEVEEVAEEEEDGEPSDAPEEGSTATAAEEADATEEPEAQTRPGVAERARSLARGKVHIDAEDLEGPLWDLEMALVSNDVEMSVAEAILDRVEERLVGETRGVTTSTRSLVSEALHDALLDVIDVDGIDFTETIAAAEKPAVVIFTGVNGVGKTTSIAKVARYLRDRGYSVVMANGDTYRAGANEQLNEHADRLDVPIITHEQGGDPTAVIYDAVEYADAHDIDVVLGDTAGRLHTSDDLMNQLAKIDRVVDPNLTVFVDEAIAGQDAVNRAREFDDAAAIDGTILTKADADPSGGAAISIAQVTGKPILFLGTGQGYDDLTVFDPESLVDALLEGN